MIYIILYKETFAYIPTFKMTGMQRFHFAREEPDGGG